MWGRTEVYTYILESVLSEVTLLCEGIRLTLNNSIPVVDLLLSPLSSIKDTVDVDERN